MPNTGHRWLPDEDSTIAALQKEGLSDTQVARALSKRYPLLSHHAIRSRAKDLRRGDIAIPNPEADGYITRWTERLRVKGDCLIAGDLQLPFYDVPMTEKLLAVAQRQGIKQLVLGGDVFDLPYWSRFDVTNAQQQMTWDKDREYGKRLFAVLCEWFDSICVVADNHARRILRKLDFKTGFVGFYGWVVGENLAAKVTASEYPIAELDNNWVVIHPAAYRQLKLSLASDLAMKLERNVIGFHGHLAAMGFSKYGQYLIADGACLTDPQLHEYIRDHITPHPNWQRGFYMLRGGVLYPFWEKNTDWGFWLGDSVVPTDESSVSSRES